MLYLVFIATGPDVLLIQAEVSPYGVSNRRAIWSSVFCWHAQTAHTQTDSFLLDLL